MSEDLKFLLKLVLGIFIVVILFIGLFAGIVAMGRNITNRICARYSDANLNKEVAVVNDTCSVLYYDVWVNVNTFRYMLPDLQED